MTDVDAQILGPNGVMLSKRLAAPSSYDAWESCWRLFSATMVSLGAASVGALDMYLTGIKLAVTQFPGRWDLVVSTDFLLRSEQWARLRRSCSRSRPAGFDPDRPWSYVIAASAYGATDSPMRDWWSNRFVLPILTTGSTAAARARVALVEGSAAATGTGAAEPSQPAGGRHRSRSRRRRGGGRRGNGNADQDKSKDKGNGDDKGKGKDICNLLNAGKAPSDEPGPCKYGRKHVCDFCKGIHPAWDCRKKKGNGKNKGGKGGR